MPGWRQSALVLLAVFAALAATAWLRPLMLPDEGRYVGVAWEMLRSGDWLVPRLNGLPFFHKPPLFYWITAASMSVFGLHEGVARAASLLGATLAAMAMFLFVHRWGGAQRARLTLVALLAQPLFFLGAQFANLDMLVAGCI
ncbi:MAG: glycosyltransferase family 39 protein, partial [Pseudomonadota bacterium]|nr:glycosyltransferase family 39 protein [Pseudomonadota bacterium]